LYKACINRKYMTLDNRNMIMSIGTRHNPGHLVERPRGDGTYLTMCFQTPFFILTDEGIQRGEPGDCIVHSTDFHHRHGTPEGESIGFQNDWIHVRGQGVDLVLMKYGVPLNRLIHTGDGKCIRPFIARIQREQLSRGPYWQDGVVQQIEQMYLSLGRLAMEGRGDRASVERDRNQVRLIEVRIALNNNIRHDWTISEMAEIARMSENRFAVLYKKVFAVSPVDDLIRNRINEAKRLLCGTSPSIKEIAYLCGFSSLSYFSKLFKKRTGLSPREYRFRRKRADS
jgi:AraC-like DNA-binding protein